jgi:hypothetical protein
MSEQLLARVVAQVCGAQCGRIVGEAVRCALEDGLGREAVAREAGREVERLVLAVLGGLHVMTAAGENDDVEGGVVLLAAAE